MELQHERLLSQIKRERDLILSRRSLLTRGAGLAVGGALAVGVIGPGALRLGSVAAQDDSPFKDDGEVLNYALTLEHLEYAFYRDGVSMYPLGMDAYGNDIATRLMAIRDHEKAHVDTLTSVLTGMGVDPVAEAKYDFGYTDAKTFLATASALENTGVSAYDGAGQYISDKDLLTAAGSIVALEARHASYLNLITGADPFPGGFEAAKSPDEILKIAGPFIVS